MNPFVRLLRKLTPVRTVIITTTRAFFNRCPSSKSAAAADVEEITDSGNTPVSRTELLCCGLATDGGPSDGMGSELLSLTGTISIEDISSNMISIEELASVSQSIRK